jgi:putative aldouronate transport system permease protein
MMNDDRRTARPAAPTRATWDEGTSLGAEAARATLLLLAVLAVLFPMWCVLVTSISSRQTINAVGGMVVIPRGIDVSAYVTLFSGGQVARAVWVSTLVTAAGTALSLFLTVTAAYGLSRPGTIGHRGLLMYFLLTFLVYPGLVPSYLVVTSLGLKDSLWALVVPSAISVFNLVVVRSFFMAIPRELVEAAHIDGASEWQILTRIMLPLSTPVLAVVGLFYAVGYWNAYFNSVLYIDDNDKWPLQRVLQSYILAGQSPHVAAAAVNIPGVTAYPPTLAIKMAVVVITVVPAVIAYPFVQRHFTKGVLVGAVKG